MEKITALYLRVSTEAQAEEGYSLAAQGEKLEAYCRMKGIERFEKLIDGGYSGSNLSRPAITELTERIRAGEIGRVVVYKLDRLSRSQKDTLYLIEDVFMPHGVDFVSINENIDTGSPYGRAMIGILSAFAQLERENIFMRTRMGMLERVKKGYWPGGGKIPFGYRYNAAEGILEPNGDATVVREMYERLLSGQSTGRIARELGFRYEPLVTQILRRESNTGVLIYKGEKYAGRHQPLVDVQTFEKAQQILKRRKQVRAASGEKLLGGLLQCGHCGAKMRYQKWGKAGDKLVCYSRDRSKPHLVHDPNCPNTGLMAEQLEQVIEQDLRRLSVRLPKMENAQQTAADLQRLLERAKQKLRRLYVLYAEAEDEALRDTIEKVKQEITRTEQALVQQQSRTQQQGHAERELAELDENWSALSPAQRQQIVRACVEKIVVRNDDVQIFYRFTAAPISNYNIHADDYRGNQALSAG